MVKSFSYINPGRVYLALKPEDDKDTEGEGEPEDDVEISPEMVEIQEAETLKNTF